MAPQLRMIKVANTAQISPHMMRIVFEGKELQNFPENQESAHVKVIIPDGENRPPTPLTAQTKKAMRSYTIRYFDSGSKQLTIDFAINDHQGPIADWANQAKPGDSLAIMGPGSKKHTDLLAPWHLLIADLTALPALAATLEALPYDAKGDAVIQIPTAEDKQTINAPKDLQLHWLINPEYNTPDLLETVQTLSWGNLSPAIFLAAEASQVKNIKAWLRNQPGFNAEKLYASAYWNAKQ